jgi:hypothetical protein
MENKNNDFFPEADYKIPTTSNYMRFSEGDNTFRVLSSAITGWEYWTKDNKPVRRKETWSEVPDDIKEEKDGSVRINHFWAFVVWNYDAKSVQILELTQKGIMKYIQGLTKNAKWGNPKGYDITVNRTGSGLDTEYTCMANPHSELDTDIIEIAKKKYVNLNALYSGADPFQRPKDERVSKEDQELTASDVGF